MRIIDAETVLDVLDMPTCIDAMEEAFRDFGKGIAASHPRQRYKVNAGNDASGYMANMIAGAVPSAGVAALRYDSCIVSERATGGKRRMEWHYPDRRSWGFVLLFSLETGAPLACIQDFSLSPLRVGATTGVAVRALAVSDASVVALYGSGNQARRNLEAICAVRPIKKVRVYSPDREHREHFATEMAASLNIEVLAVDRPDAALEGAAIVMCATNSSQPVVDGTKLVPGQLVINIANSDHVHRRQEVDDATMLRSQLIVVNHLATLRNNDQRELLDLMDDGRVPESRVVELGEVLIDETKGRQSPSDIIYYKSNTGMGIQFAAAGAAILKICERKNLGHSIPTEWFGADVGSWLDRGFLPAP